MGRGKYGNHLSGDVGLYSNPHPVVLFQLFFILCSGIKPYIFVLVIEFGIIILWY
jgi:hypothetical protein